MLNLLGTIGANALSLPGILGVAAGMTTRNLMLGGLYGAVIGFVETLVFAEFTMAKMDTLELGVGMAVGLIAGCLGSLIRRLGVAAQ